MSRENIKQKYETAKIKVGTFIWKTKVKAKQFWEENKEVIVVATPIVLGVVGKIANQCIKEHNYKREQDLKYRYIYDRSLGCYHELRRKPTTREYAEIARRKAEGETLTEILIDMRLVSGTELYRF